MNVARFCDFCIDDPKVAVHIIGNHAGCDRHKQAAIQAHQDDVENGVFGRIGKRIREERSREKNR